MTEATIAQEPSSPRGLRERARDLFELGKFKIFDLWIGVAVASSLLPFERLREARSLLLLALVALTLIGLAAATCSLDDVTGLRDGVDEANHTQGTRYGVNKPVLDGRVSELAALRFAWSMIGLAAICALGSALLIWPPPAWLVLAEGLVAVSALNYSYWLKLSYRGMGELVMFITAAGTVALPYGFITRTWTPAVGLCASLVGLWLVQVIVFSNTKDAEGDRANGRMTVAALTSELGNRRFIAAVFLVGWLAPLAMVLHWELPLGYLIALTPTWLLQAYQLRTGVVRQRWLKARLLGFWLFRLGVISLIFANLWLPQ